MDEDKREHEQLSSRVLEREREDAASKLAWAEFGSRVLARRTLRC